MIQKVVSSSLGIRCAWTFMAAWATISTAVAAAASESAKSPTEKRPLNFVLMLMDDMGWRDLGCYGSTYHQTPRIDRLSGQSMKFTQAYTACCVCSPTRASIMTGRYPARLHVTNFIPGRRVPFNSPILPPDYNLQLSLDEITIPEALEAAGYVSGSFGKWHLGPDDTHGPLQQGFDEAFTKQKRLPADPKNVAALTDMAIKFLETHQKQPFFLYLPHFAVHVPLEGTTELIAKYEKLKQPGQSPNDAVYAAMTESLDVGIGRVLDKLDELKLSDHTVVMFTSDNGGLATPDSGFAPSTSNAPLRYGKGYLYEGGHRVPLLVRWPGVVQAGSICDAPVCSIDYFPTIIELSGLKPPTDRQIDGVSFVSLLHGGQPSPRDALYWHYPHFSNQGGLPGGAIRQGDLKLIESYTDHHVELYNLKDDLGETHDLAQQMPRRAAELREKLHQWRNRVAAQPMVPNPAYDPSKPTDWSKGEETSPKKKTVPVSDSPVKPSQDRLEGMWQVMSAAFQLTGPMYYLFTEDTLSIIAVMGDKTKTEPTVTQMSSYHYQLDTTSNPKEMRLTPVGKTGASTVNYVCEFRDGTLWIAPAVPGKAATQLLRPNGGSGWLVGIEKLSFVPKGSK